MQLPVAIIGASGYAGVEATRLLAAHPAFELKLATSDRWEDDALQSRLGPCGPAGAHHYAAHPETGADAVRAAQGCVAALLCTPTEASLALAPALLAAGVRVVDLSGAFRLRDARSFEHFYRLEQSDPRLLTEAVYGMPELGAQVRAEISKARLVANPGCYPTAALLAVTPLVRAGLVEPRGIIVDAKSGVTGAGRQAKEEFSFAEVDEDVRAYKLLSHQHTPEIARHLARGAHRADADIALTFTAHLLPVRRGILATCYARPRQGVTVQTLVNGLTDAYAASTFVDVVAPEKVTLGAVVGTNRARVGVVSNGDVVVILASIDNLLKGAAGQAIQNLNLLFTLDETAGLAQLQRTIP